MSAGEASGAALEQLRKKQARRGRWAKIGGFIVAAGIALNALSHRTHAAPDPAAATAGAGSAQGVAAAPGGGAVGDVATCDSTTATSALTTTLNGAIKARGAASQVAGITDIRETGVGQNSRRCTARVAINDGSAGTAFYHLDSENIAVDNFE